MCPQGKTFSLQHYKENDRTLLQVTLLDVLVVLWGNITFSIYFPFGNFYTV